MIVLADYGLPGWDVFHQGLAEQTPLTIGTAVILVGAVLLLAMLVLREPIGVGTIANVIVVGLVLDAVLWVFDEPASVAVRVTLTLTGPIVVAIGSGFYIGVRLGPGPRDGLMTALGQRGITIWKARFGIEAIALTSGILLGGTIGWGTVWFLVAIGPTVHFCLKHLSLPMEPDEAAAA
ncbi:MAG TPA: hypothetical protein QF905_00890 [Acidimicrobiales bacterium]|jgi:uncharacterized membrane protein YczE|nr:hypothetical protein [Actinomycetota bacterium]MDP6062755.1 hypothetical protein [Acidimicrobiales bacterium]MDP6213958.1 hypothetical protein [Acidimicrobiales bacterium]MDP7208319.1 hypothetical protein [Acidimicrobiales bacterium]HJL88870.1 hypothetical protein [Acidimicrobiales bacterium]|tara:strand:- start:6506 stop:7042 length:537 start_codon:yes stop_codon:yes gene_type:complete